jgi:hypothetical protein
MTRTTLFVALALCLGAVATSLAILAAVVENPGGFVHTEPRPQPALVDPNPTEPVAAAPAPEPEPPGPRHSTVPPGGAIHPALVDPNPTEPEGDGQSRGRTDP